MLERLTEICFKLHAHRFGICFFPLFHSSAEVSWMTQKIGQIWWVNKLRFDTQRNRNFFRGFRMWMIEKRMHWNGTLSGTMCQNHWKSEYKIDRRSWLCSLNQSEDIISCSTVELDLLPLLLRFLFRDEENGTKTIDDILLIGFA